MIRYRRLGDYSMKKKWFLITTIRIIMRLKMKSFCILSNKLLPKILKSSHRKILMLTFMVCLFSQDIFVHLLFFCIQWLTIFTSSINMLLKRKEVLLMLILLNLYSKIYFFLSRLLKGSKEIQLMHSFRIKISQKFIKANYNAEDIFILEKLYLVKAKLANFNRGRSLNL